MNATAVKFGYPGFLVREFDRWVLLLRPWQVTLGSLVVVCKEPVNRFGDISPEASLELQKVVSLAEKILLDAFRYEKINHVMLMMVDPDVHFHVIPRYSGPRSFGGVQFADTTWPKPPDVFYANAVPGPVMEQILEILKESAERTAATGT